MTHLVALDPNQHRNLIIDTDAIEHHGALLNLIPIVPSEFSSACCEFPIVVTKNEETGQFGFAVMLGFEQGQNLFWEKQKWQGLYMPLQLQRQPFFIGEANPESPNSLPLCFDQSSPAIADSHHSDNCQSIFDNDGVESEYFQQIKQCIAELLRGEEQAKQLLEFLVSRDMLQSMSLEVTFADGQSKRLNGLYTVNRESLGTLDEATCFELQNNGQLEAIYVMLASLNQIYRLIERRNTQMS